MNDATKPEVCEPIGFDPSPASALGVGEPVSSESEMTAAKLMEQLGFEGPGRLTEEGRHARLVRSFDLGLRSAMDLRDLWTGQMLVIVGGGPSLTQALPEIADLVAGGASLAAVNKSHDWLIERGIVPTFGVLADPKPWVADYMSPHPDVKYLIASQCDDATFENFKGVPDVYLWHALCDEDGADRKLIFECAQKRGVPAYAVVGGQTTTLRLFDIAPLLLGFRELRFIAVDSSCENGATHAYTKPKHDAILEVPLALIDPLDGRELATGYWTTLPLWHQFRQFELLLAERREGIREGRFPKVRIGFHGRGILPDWAALRGLHADPNRAAELRAAVPPVVPIETVDLNFTPEPEEAAHATA